jgi:hypothetical protein
VSFLAYDVTVCVAYQCETNVSKIMGLTNMVALITDHTWTLAYDVTVCVAYQCETNVSKIMGLTNMVALITDHTWTLALCNDTYRLTQYFVVILRALISLRRNQCPLLNRKIMGSITPEYA